MKSDLSDCNTGFTAELGPFPKGGLIFMFDTTNKGMVDHIVV